MKLANNILRDNTYRSSGAAIGTGGGVQAPPPIPYERCERSKSKDNDNVSVFKLRTNPSSDDSPTYELKALTFKAGTVEEYILWKRDLAKICVGQNVSDAAGKYAMTRRLLEGDALAAFNKAATATGNETNTNYATTMRELAKHVFPKNALALQRQWFHRYMRKPSKHTMREYVARVIEINEMLVEFPSGFNTSQLIQEDEIKDLLEFSVPWQWRIEMVKQAFRPIDHDLADIVEFCERQETAESVFQAIKTANTYAGHQTMNGTGDTTWNKRKQKPNKKGRGSWKNEKGGFLNNKNKKSGRCESFNDTGGKDGCRLHPDAVTHTTAECRVVQSQIDNMKSMYAARGRGGGPPNKRQKTSTNNDASKKQYNNKPGGDLHTLLDDIEHVKARLEKELKQRGQEGGKRKRENYELENGEIVENLQGSNGRELNAQEFNGPNALNASVEENFSGELAELSLSDVHDSDLEGLESLSDEELDA
jgi:hypothetical protein